jgi:hypothetical protein
VPPLPHDIRQFSEREQIDFVFQDQALVEAEPLSRFDLRSNR